MLHQTIGITSNDPTSGEARGTATVSGRQESRERGEAATGNTASVCCAVRYGQQIKGNDAWCGRGGRHGQHCLSARIDEAEIVGQVVTAGGSTDLRLVPSAEGPRGGTDVFSQGCGDKSDSSYTRETVNDGARGPARGKSAGQWDRRGSHLG